jgi:hypothetical protein
MKTKHAYYESKWKADELDEKTVEFWLPTCAEPLHDIGRFRIHVYVDLIAVCICVARPGGECIHCVWDPSLADTIHPHPDQSVAQFRLALKA